MFKTKRDFAATFFVALTLFSDSQGGFTKTQVQNATRIFVSVEMTKPAFVPVTIPGWSALNGFVVSMHSLNSYLVKYNLLKTERNFKVTIAKGDEEESGEFGLRLTDKKYLLLLTDKPLVYMDEMKFYLKIKVANGTRNTIEVLGYPAKEKLSLSGQDHSVVLIDHDDLGKFPWMSKTDFIAGDGSYKFAVYTHPEHSSPDDGNTSFHDLASFHLFTQIHTKKEAASV